MAFSVNDNHSAQVGRSIVGETSLGLVTPLNPFLISGWLGWADAGTAWLAEHVPAVSNTGVDTVAAAASEHAQLLIGGHPGFYPGEPEAAATTESAALTYKLGGTNLRLTQAAVETLQRPGSPNLRLTQATVETLIRLPSAADIAAPATSEHASLVGYATDTEAPATSETVIALFGGPAADRLAQEAVELLQGPDSPTIRLAQEAVELLQGPDSPTIRLAQEAVELLQGPDIPHVRLAQAAIEIIGLIPPLTKENHSFLGVMATGKGKNASFVF